MREIKFRGLTADGVWVHGYLMVKREKYYSVGPGSYISNDVGMPFAYLVRPETVGQYIGIEDKNGKEIYEGDICKVPIDYGPGGTRIQSVEIHLTKYDGWQLKEWMFDIGVEIIGNIYENPGLMEATT